ncbi:hypothetical protein ElyMa_002511500 [Elysia marginata]|uniref:Uncharacterized protein n=1 Tax=Elysia marginata TaxID=1093978 RepID=A0AAV4GSF8_9GAST|nr:hypothetical protein ElyMa_002511500 [Elysia marginata]
MMVLRFGPLLRRGSRKLLLLFFVVGAFPLARALRSSLMTDWACKNFNQPFGGRRACVLFEPGAVWGTPPAPVTTMSNSLASQLCDAREARRIDAAGLEWEATKAVLDDASIRAGLRPSVDGPCSFVMTGGPDPVFRFDPQEAVRRRAPGVPENAWLSMLEPVTLLLKRFTHLHTAWDPEQQVFFLSDPPSAPLTPNLSIPEIRIDMRVDRPSSMKNFCLRAKHTANQLMRRRTAKTWRDNTSLSPPNISSKNHLGGTRAYFTGSIVAPLISKTTGMSFSDTSVAGAPCAGGTLSGPSSARSDNLPFTESAAPICTSANGTSTAMPVLYASTSAPSVGTTAPVGSSTPAPNASAFITSAPNASTIITSAPSASAIVTSAPSASAIVTSAPSASTIITSAPNASTFTSAPSASPALSVDTSAASAPNASIFITSAPSSTPVSSVDIITSDLSGESLLDSFCLVDKRI